MCTDSTARYYGGQKQHLMYVPGSREAFTLHRVCMYVCVCVGMHVCARSIYSPYGNHMALYL